MSRWRSSLSSPCSQKRCISLLAGSIATHACVLIKAEEQICVRKRRGTEENSKTNGRGKEQQGKAERVVWV